MSSLSEKFSWLGGRLARYFFQGLLLIAPASFTVYVIYVIFEFLNNQTKPLFERIFHFSFPGLGILVFAGFITLLGFVGSTVLVRPIVTIIENLLEHTPLVKDIYSSFKDFISAFISNKKKFNTPVIVEMGKGTGIHRLGFITDEDLTEFHIENKVAVYIPMSYTFTGQLFIVNKDQVTLLPSNMSADMIKYILSGGVTEMEDKGNNG
jgi:uncharacterized membrane protein